MGFIKGRAYPIILAMAKDGNEQAKKLLDKVDSMSQGEVESMVSEIFNNDNGGEVSDKKRHENKNFVELAIRDTSKMPDWRKDLEDKEFENELKARTGGKYSTKEQQETKNNFPSLKKETVKAKVDNIAKQVKRQPGTYKIENGKPQKVDLNKGFSASFFRPEITDQEAEEIEEIIKDNLGPQYVGVFEGEGELSYNVDKETADIMVDLFNQKSVWNNEIQDEVANPNYDENKKVDYKQAIQQLKKLLDEKKLKGV